MNRIKWFVALVVTIVAMACNPEPEPEPTPEPEGLTFETTIVATTRTTVTFDVVPSDEEAAYFCYVMEREEVDDFTKDRYLIATILQTLTEEASNVGKTFEEYMSTVVDRGTVDDGSFSGLAMDSEYYLLVFGVDEARGYAASTELQKTPFRTANATASECRFEVVTTVEDNNVTFDVSPTDKETLWYLCTLRAEAYDFYTNDPEGYLMTVQGLYEYYFSEEISSYQQAGYTTEQIVAALIHSGDLVLEAKGLNANTEHVYLIAGLELDEEGITIVTPVAEGRYTTGDAAKSKMTFDIKVWDIEQMAASVSITPSNNVDTYCALIQPWDGVSTADEVMHQIVDQWGGWMDIMANDRGPVEHSGANKFKLPAADTLYYVIAFGYKGGITTEAAMVTFRTLPGGSVEDVNFEITTSSATSYGFTMNISSSDPTIYYIPGVCLAEEYDEAEFVAMEEETFNYFYTGSKDFNPSITVAEVLDQYYYNGNCTVEVSGLIPDREFMGYIYALDTATGKVSKCFTFDNIARTLALGSVSPTVELVGYYSGDEEAGSIFGQPAATAGKAITVVKYNDLDGARTLYTTMIGGDCTNSVAYSDAELWNIAGSYWNTCNIAQPYSFYTAEWNVEQTALAYATDIEGRMGAIGRLYTLPTADTKSPISELKTLVDRLNEESKASTLALPSSLVVDPDAVPAPSKLRATIVPVE